MSIFPTTILLATDGSKEAELAARTAVDIAATTNSELHMVTVARHEHAHVYDLPEEPGDVQKSLYEAIERKARELLDEQVKKIEQSGGTIPQEVHLLRGHPDREIVHLAEEIGAGLIVNREPRPRRGKEGPHGKRFRFGCPAGPLSGVDSARRAAIRGPCFRTG
jgi:nucleotide-binding universal stress UspA family protein